MSTFSRKITTLALAIGASVGGTVLLSGGAANAAAAPQSQGAFVIKEFGCGGYGYQGPQVVTYEKTHAVVTSSGNTKLTCHFEDGPEVSETVNDKGFLCGTYLGVTYDSHFVYTKGGRGTLTCYVHSS